MTSHLADPNPLASSEEMLDALERDALAYVLHETNLGLVVLACEHYRSGFSGD